MIPRVVWERARHGYTATVGDYLLIVLDPEIGALCTWEVCGIVAWFAESGECPDVDAAMREAVRVLEGLYHD